MNRTLENCKLIKKMVTPPKQYDGKCEGYSGNTDEPHEVCKECKLHYLHDDEVEFYLNEAKGC